MNAKRNCRNCGCDVSHTTWFRIGIAGGRRSAFILSPLSLRRGYCRGCVTTVICIMDEKDMANA
jgi:hypothetical protein